jgi:hypothetical protein
MKPIGWIKNLYMKVPAMTWMWIGCGLIVLSIALQAATLFLQSHQSLTFALNLAGYIFAAFSVPFTIVQAYRSALDFEQERRMREAQVQYVYDRTPEGTIRRNISQLRTEMHMNDQGPHS